MSDLTACVFVHVRRSNLTTFLVTINLDFSNINSIALDVLYVSCVHRENKCIENQHMRKIFGSVLFSIVIIKTFLKSLTCILEKGEEY